MPIRVTLLAASVAAAVLLAVPGCADDTSEQVSTAAPAAVEAAPASVQAVPADVPAAAPDRATTITPAPAASAVIPAPAASTTGEAAAPATAAQAVGSSTDLRAYLVRDGLLAPVARTVPAATPLGGALEALLAGTTPAEAALGFGTAIPAGTTLLGVDLDAGVATVDLSGTFDDGGGTLSQQLRLGQVVFTATQLDNVTSVVFRLDGQPVTVFSSEGIVLSGPQDRLPYTRLTSGVLVDTPMPGATVLSPVVVRGESDSYEANFQVDVYAGSTLLSSRGYQAGGAWGTWRDFEISVPVPAAPGPIRLDLYDEGGCGTDPECPPIVHNVLPLVLGVLPATS